jgi:uncharacterized lipoprotein YajG
VRTEVTIPDRFGRTLVMKKLIPVVLGVWVIFLVGCTTTTETSTTTTQRQTTARMDPTLDNTRTTNPINMGPR